MIKRGIWITLLIAIVLTVTLAIVDTTNDEVAVNGDVSVGGGIRGDSIISPNYRFLDIGYSAPILRPHPRVQNPVITKDMVTTCTGGTVDFVADPFLFYENGTFYIFHEVMCNGGTEGQAIGYSYSADGLTWTWGGYLISGNGYHMSYPQVYKVDGGYYMFPMQRSGGTGVFKLYKASTFPTGWAVYETWTVPDEANLHDATIFYHKNKWWMLGQVNGTDNANLYYSDTLVNASWTAHPNNPVISSRATASRPAGRPITKDDYVIMFYQDSVAEYGDMVRAYKTTLTTTAFSDIAMVPNPFLKEVAEEKWRADGMHQVDILPLDDGKAIAVVDGHYNDSGDKWSIGIFEHWDF